MSEDLEDVIDYLKAYTVMCVLLLLIAITIVLPPLLVYLATGSGLATGCLAAVTFLGSIFAIGQMAKKGEKEENETNRTQSQEEG